MVIDLKLMSGRLILEEARLGHVDVLCEFKYVLRRMALALRWFSGSTVGGGCGPIAGYGHILFPLISMDDETVPPKPQT